MTQPDETHTVLYRAIADFSEVIREAAAARAAQKTLADEHVKQNERIKASDNAVSQNRQRLALIERGLIEDAVRRRQREESELRESRLELGRYDQAVAHTVSTQRQAAGLTDQVVSSIGRQVDALFRAKRAHEEHTRAVQADLTATQSFLAAQAAAATALARRPVTPAPAGGGAATALAGGGGGGGGFSLAQLAAITALVGSVMRSQRPGGGTTTQTTQINTSQVFISPAGGGGGGGATATRVALPAPTPTQAAGALPGGRSTDLDPGARRATDFEQRVRARIDRWLAAVGAIEQDLDDFDKVRLVSVASDLERRRVSAGTAARNMASGSQRGDIFSQIAAVIRQEGAAGVIPPQTRVASGTTGSAVANDLRSLFQDIRREVADLRLQQAEALRATRDAQQATNPTAASVPSTLAGRDAREQSAGEAFQAALAESKRTRENVSPVFDKSRSAQVREEEIRQFKAAAAGARDQSDATTNLADALTEQATALKKVRDEEKAKVEQDQAVTESDARFRASLEDTSNVQTRFADMVRQSEAEITRLAGRLRSIETEAEGRDLLAPLSRAARIRVGQLADLPTLDPTRRSIVERALGDVAADVPQLQRPPGGRERQVLETVAAVRQAESPAEVFTLLNGLTNAQLKEVAEKLGTSTTGARLKRELEARIVKGRFPELTHPALTQRRPPRTRAQQDPDVPAPPDLPPGVEGFAIAGGGARVAAARASQARRTAAEAEETRARFEEAVRAEADKRRQAAAEGPAKSVATSAREQAKANKEDAEALKQSNAETTKAHGALGVFLNLLERKNTLLRDQVKAHDADRLAMRRSAEGAEKYSGFLNELSSDLQHFQDRVSNRQRFDVIDAEAHKRSVSARDEDTAATARGTEETNKAEQAVASLLKAFQDKNKALREQAGAHAIDTDAVRESVSAVRDLGGHTNQFTQTIHNARAAVGDHGLELRKTSREASDAYSIWQHFTTAVQNQATALKDNRIALGQNASVTNQLRNVGQNAAQGARVIGQAAQTATPQVGALTSAVRGLRNESRRRGGDGGGFIGELIERFANLGDRIGRGLGRAVTHIVSFRAAVYALLLALGPVVAVLGSLGAAAIGAGNTLISLAGAAAALPAIFGAAAVGIGTLVAALSPIANVLKAYQATQKATAAGSRELGDAQRDAADRVRNAQRAYVNAARALANAQYDEKKAQEDLNRARRDARRDLEDLRAALERTSLNEKDAVLSLKEAQDAYLRTLADPNATLLDRERALLRIYQAEQDLKDVRRDNQRTAEDAAEAEARGIENSERVIDAKRRAFEASEAVIDAQLRLVDATEDLVDAQREQAAGGTAAATAADALADALEKLGPNTKAVALAVIEMAKAWAKVKETVSERFFAPVVPQLENLKSLLPVVEQFLYGAADAMGAVVAQGIEMVSSGPWKQDFATLAASNTRLLFSFGQAGLYAADGLRHISVAAAPFTEWVADAVARTARGFRDWAEGARESGAIADFLATTQDRISQVWVIVKNLTAGFASLFMASEEFTSWFLDRVESVTQRFREWAKAQEETTSPFKQWLEDVKPLLSDVWHLIEEIAGAFGHMASSNENIDEARKILQILADRILPTIADIFDDLSRSGALSTFAEAIATGLEAFQEFIDRGGINAIQLFAEALLFVANTWKTLIENDFTGTAIVGIASAFGVLVAAAAIGKLTGLFALARLLRGIVRSGIRLRDLRLGSVLDDVARDRPGTGGGLGEALGERGSTPRNPVYVYVVNDDPDAPTSRRRPPGTVPPVVTGGGGGGGVPWWQMILRVALPAAAVVAVGEAVRGLINDPNRRTDPTTLGTLVSPIQSTVLPATSFIGRNLLSPLFPDSSPLSDPNFWTVENIRPSLDKFKAIWDGFWEKNGILVQGLIDSDFVQSLTDFFAGFTNWFADNAGKPLELVQEYLLDPLMEWLAPFKDIFLGIADFLVAWQREANEVVLAALGAIGDFFAELGRIIAGWYEQGRMWFEEHIGKPVRDWFVATGEAILGWYRAGREWFEEHIGAPVRNFFINIGRTIVGLYSAGRRWFENNVGAPVRGFFVSVGNAIVSWYRSGRRWFEDHIGIPVRNFFATIGNFLRVLPQAIQRYAESLPFIGPFIRRRREAREEGVSGSSLGSIVGGALFGFQSGGVVGGRSQGVDTVPILATVGEFMVRKRVVDKPGVRELLSALNEERLDPAILFGALDTATRQTLTPARDLFDRVRGVPTTVNNNRTGMQMGDVIINNPRAERSTTSIRRTLQTLAFMAER